MWGRQDREDRDESTPHAPELDVDRSTGASIPRPADAKAGGLRLRLPDLLRAAGADLSWSPCQGDLEAPRPFALPQMCETPSVLADA